MNINEEENIVNAAKYIEKEGGVLARNGSYWFVTIKEESKYGGPTEICEEFESVAEARSWVMGFRVGRNFL